MEYEINRKDYEELSFSAVKHADPESFSGRLFLNYFIVNSGQGRVCEFALEKLGGEPDYWFLEDADYWTAYGRLENENDLEYLKELAFGKRCFEACFAFCRLTGYSFVPPENDYYSHRTFECGVADGITNEDKINYCRLMIDTSGPFCKEAEDYITRIPRYGHFIVKDYRFKDNIDAAHDKRLEEIVTEICNKLEGQGRFVLKFSDIPGRIMVLVETVNDEMCEEYLKAFEDSLKKEGFIIYE